MKINILFIAALTALTASVSVNSLSTNLINNKDHADTAYISAVRRDLIKPDPELSKYGNCRKYCREKVNNNFNFDLSEDVQIQECAVKCLQEYETIFDVKADCSTVIRIEGDGKRLPDPCKSDTMNCHDYCHSISYADKTITNAELWIQECVLECLKDFSKFFAERDSVRCSLF